MLSTLDYWKQRFQAAGAEAAVADAVQTWRAEVEPGSVSDRALRAVESFYTTLTHWRSILERWRSVLAAMGEHASAQEHQAFRLRLSQYEALSAPFYADARPMAEVGAVPLLGISVIVAGLGIGVAGCAWALAYGAQAIEGMKASEVELRELEIRWEAVQKGLLPGAILEQPSTLRDRPASSSPADGVWVGLGVAAALGVAGGLAWYALRSR